MENSNINDFKVVEFFNSTDFDFTPELGCMYDGRPLFVGSGERRQFPYHVGYQLSVNLAKAVLVKGAPLHDPNSNNPVGTPLWADEKFESIRSSFLTELYTEEKATPKSETDILMAKVEEFTKQFLEKQNAKSSDDPKEKVQSVQEIVAPELSQTKGFIDKGEVIAELEKRGIQHDRRKSKEALEQLLA